MAQNRGFGPYNGVPAPGFPQIEGLEGSRRGQGQGLAMAHGPWPAPGHMGQPWPILHCVHVYTVQYQPVPAQMGPYGPMAHMGPSGPIWASPAQYSTVPEPTKGPSEPLLSPPSPPGQEGSGPARAPKYPLLGQKWSLFGPLFGPLLAGPVPESPRIKLKLTPSGQEASGPLKKGSQKWSKMGSKMGPLFDPLLTGYGPKSP